MAIPGGGGYPLFTPQLHSCLKEFRGVEEQETEGWGQNEPLSWGRSRKNCPLNKEGPASKVPVQGSREMGQREALPAAWRAVWLVIKQPRVGWGGSAAAVSTLDRGQIIQLAEYS